MQTSKTNFEQIPVSMVKRIVEELYEQKEVRDQSADVEIHSGKTDPARVLSHSLRRKGH